MRIGIDCRFAVGPRTGVTNYLLNLLENLTCIDSEDEYFLYIHREDKDNRIPKHPRFRKKVVHGPPLLWKNLFLPIDIKREKIDLFHAPAYTIPITPVGKTVVTIHDLIHMVNPEWFSQKELFLLRGPIRYAAHRADHIIAVSENTATDLVRFYKIDRKKISVTYEAASEEYRKPINPAIIERVKEKYQLKEPFILYVGVLFPRRNIPRLLNAFARLKEENDLPHQLVIVGQDRGFFNIPELLRKESIQDSVILLGHVPWQDMPALYRLANVFIYPSIYEGFGLPILEAMASGVPVITSNLSSLKEISGKAAVLVDPYDTEEIKKALQELITNEQLRQSLVARGKENLKRFSWQQMAEQTLAIYKKLAQV